jgi:uncharacterized protein (TIGR03382 family)
MGRGIDRVYADCSDRSACSDPHDPCGRDEGVGEGVHRVRMRAELPGTDIVLETEEIEIELSCGAEPMPMPIDPPMHSTPSGSSCSASGPGAGGVAGLALVALGLVRRRRR